MAIVYANKSETKIYESPSGRKVVNHVLLGTRLDVIQDSNDYYQVDARGLGRSGWVKKSEVRDTPVLKIFFVDVGQGDGAIVESPEGALLIDGGPHSHFYKFLKYRYRKIIADEGKVKIKAIVMSHPDWDHFNGLTAVLKDKNFHIGKIYHNGIIRYKSKPPGRETKLGNTMTKMIDGVAQEVLNETYNDLNSVQRLMDEGHLMSSFEKFWQAALIAKAEGRLGSAKRITVRDGHLTGYNSADSDKLKVEILGPVPVPSSSRIQYVTFPDAHNVGDPAASMSESHTINGHSIVLKLSFGDHSVLMGGDLNIPAELHLLKHYGDANPFRVDVAKACHHGSSDYLVDYLKKVKPLANVVSSGDNKSFDHPMSDAVGAAAKHTRGNHPLFFSTELARAVNSSGTHYGLINLRSNGKILTMAQMKEVYRGADVWDSYTLPWKGKFNEEIKEYRNL